MGKAWFWFEFCHALNMAKSLSQSTNGKGRLPCAYPRGTISGSLGYGDVAEIGSPPLSCTRRPSTQRAATITVVALFPAGASHGMHQHSQEHSVKK
jgi:hypothetical protein